MASIRGKRRKIKIGHLQLFSLLSGAQRVTLDELTRLDKKLYDPYIICKEACPLTEAAQELDIKCLFVANLVREISPIKDLLALWQLYRLFYLHRFDIYHY